MKKMKIDVDVLTAGLRLYVIRNGMPINVRYGNETTAADWLSDVVDIVANKREQIENSDIENEDRGSSLEKELKEAAETGMLELSSSMSDTLLKAAKLAKKDVAVGVRAGHDKYEYCPACGGVIGQSAFYCKHCGQKIREGGRG